MQKLSDYVIDYVIRNDIDTVFTVSGGGIMHLIDSLGRRSDDISYVCNFHEQACAIAAEAYARIRHTPGVCLVTTGPGSTNALSALAGAWVDSIPVVVISGQVRCDLIADYDHVRQMGPQEINIIDMARPVTKYAVTVTDPATIKDELDKAFSIAVSGRPGPVWISLPLDIQNAQVDLPPGQRQIAQAQTLDASGIQALLPLLEKSKRPLLVLGSGVHLGGAQDRVTGLMAALNIPTMLTWGSLDLLDDTDPLYAGRFGPFGHRHANFLIQTCDLLLCVGASMSVTNIGFSTETFSPHSIKIVVNTDASEMNKMQPAPDIKIHADAGAFIEALIAQGSFNMNIDSRWIPTVKQWREQYPTITSDRLEDEQHVNSYVFLDQLSNFLAKDDVLLTGNGLDACSMFQCYKAKRGQRAFTNINFGAMGWDLPACVGASAAQHGKKGKGNHGQRTILVTGDGSLQLNVQELLTMGHNKMNCYIFVLNNDGYESIRATQNNHFGGHLVGADASSGVGNPDFELLAKAYGLSYHTINNNAEINDRLRMILDMPGPVLCEVNLSYRQGRSPRLMSRRGADGRIESPALENMFPFLPQEEIDTNLNRFVQQ